MNKNINNTKSDIDPTSQKLVSTITSFFTYFSIVIILFLVLSYVGNQYIPGIGLMFLPMFLPNQNGIGFYIKPYLASLFHKPSDEIDKSKFIIEDTETNLKKYKLLEMGPSFYHVIGGFLGKTLPKKPEIKEIEIVLQDYNDDLNPFQKYILIIFGSLQMFIGSLMTLFSSVAYLFSGKHGMFLNMPFEREKNLEKNKSNRMFKNLDDSILKSKDDKIIIKSGWSKLLAVFSFAYFIPIDKLTYGTQFYLMERSSFVQRFKYFFFILFIIFFIGTLQMNFQGGITGITFGIILGIIMYMIFVFRIYNEDYQTEPFPNMSSLLDKYRYGYEGSYINQTKNMNNENFPTVYNYKKKNFKYDNLYESIEKVKKKLQTAIDEYSKAYEKVSEGIQPNDQ